MEIFVTIVGKYTSVYHLQQYKIGMEFLIAPSCHSFKLFFYLYNVYNMSYLKFPNCTILHIDGRFFLAYIVNIRW